MLFDDGHVRGFNYCRECGASLPVADDAPWRLAETCTRCGMVQEWATSVRRACHAARAMDAGGADRTAAPSCGSAGPRGAAPRGPGSAPPCRTPPQDPPRRPGAASADPFLPQPADDARAGLGLSRVQRRSIHRPSPDRRGFRQKGPISRVSSALGRKGFNCCGSLRGPASRRAGPRVAVRRNLPPLRAGAGLGDLSPPDPGRTVEAEPRAPGFGPRPELLPQVVQHLGRMGLDVLYRVDLADHAVGIDDERPALREPASGSSGGRAVW